MSYFKGFPQIAVLYKVIVSIPSQLPVKYTVLESTSSQLTAKHTVFVNISSQLPLGHMVIVSISSQLPVKYVVMVSISSRLPVRYMVSVSTPSQLHVRYMALIQQVWRNNDLSGNAQHPVQNKTCWNNDASIAYIKLTMNSTKEHRFNYKQILKRQWKLRLSTVRLSCCFNLFSGSTLFHSRLKHIKNATLNHQKWLRNWATKITDSGNLKHVYLTAIHMASLACSIICMAIFFEEKYYFHKNIFWSILWLNSLWLTMGRCISVLAGGTSHHIYPAINKKKLNVGHINFFLISSEKAQFSRPANFSTDCFLNFVSPLEVHLFT